VDTQGLPTLLIVGSPNVGKSVLFNHLTGIYATVANYPGTTVEVMRGKTRLGDQTVAIVDTPGMYNLLPITEEERVARAMLLDELVRVVVHVVDAKNLERMLPMTLQLIEAGRPVILVVNLMDEAERLGLQIDITGLQARLGIPVIGTALATGRGRREIKQAIHTALITNSMATGSQTTTQLVRYPEVVEEILAEIEQHLELTYPLTRRAIALLYLQGDAEIRRLVAGQEPEQAAAIEEMFSSHPVKTSQALRLAVAKAQRQAAVEILATVFHQADSRNTPFAARLSDILIRPITGLPIFLAVIFLLYQFIGVLGAQVLVEWLETVVFEAHINPWINSFVDTWIAWPALRDLIGGEFGVVTLGLRYAFAIVLPIVATFFLAFSLIEDSGYLPRLALLIDRVFKKIGLNGRAVIPLVLGFGCDTMATITTRTLETRRERVIATLLLSLAIPCSAQLGVMLGLMAGQPALLVVWLAVMSGVFLLTGYLAARLVPGEKPVFYIELPPLRLPRPRNILVKTYTRMEWYLREVFPLFILASLLIWIGRLIGLFELAVDALVPIVRWLGLPEQTAVAFLFGFFRRDYGAAGLYDLQATMNSAQLLVAVVTMTLFIPCIAQFMVTVKERGWKTALGMAVFIFPFALLVGGMLSSLLRLLGYDL
jgi:ferrous iron transport protein B